MYRGRHPHLPEICAQSDPPFRKRRFWQISLNSAAAVKVSEKSSIIANRKSTTRFPSSHRWTPCVIPKSPKNGSKWKFLHLALLFIFSLQVIVDTLYLVCGLNIASPSLQMTNWLWNGRGRVTWPILNLLSPLRYLWNGLSYRLQIGVHVDHSKPSLRTTNCSWKGRGHCHVTSLIFEK